MTTTTAKSGALAMMTLALTVGIAAREIKGKGSENRHGDRAQGGGEGTSWAFSFVCLILTSSFYRTSVQRLQEDSTFSSPVTFRTVLKTEVTAKGDIICCSRINCS